MASIRARGGHWNVQVRKLGHPAYTKTFTRKKAALQWARRIEADIDSGLYLDSRLPQITTLADVLHRKHTNDDVLVS